MQVLGQLRLFENLPQSDPASGVQQYLRAIGIEGETGDLILNKYREYRDPNSDRGIDLSEIGLSLSEWEDLTQGQEKKIRSLDRVSQDYLRSINLRLYLRDQVREGGLLRIFSQEILTDTRLNDTPQTIEAVSDLLLSQGVEFVSDNGYEEGESRLYFCLISDLPQRRFSVGDLGLPIEWISDTANYSRMIRRFEVELQKGLPIGEVVSKWTPYRYNLPELISVYGRPPVPLIDRVKAIALCRELRLWDPDRDLYQPSLRRISDSMGVKYGDLIRYNLYSEILNNQVLLHKIPYQVLRQLIAEVEEISRTGGLTDPLGRVSYSHR